VWILCVSLVSLACGQSGSGALSRPGSVGDRDAGQSGATEAGEDSAVGFADAEAGSPSLADSAPSSGPPGTLALQIGGTDQAVTYDVMRVSGQATLGGTLSLQYTGGYVPPVGQRFVLIEADGGIVGSFATVTSPGVQVETGQDAENFWVTVK
jgi:hypothetical protein